MLHKDANGLCMCCYQTVGSPVFLYIRHADLILRLKDEVGFVRSTLNVYVDTVHGLVLSDPGLPLWKFPVVYCSFFSLYSISLKRLYSFSWPFKQNAFLKGLSTKVQFVDQTLHP